MKPCPRDHNHEVREMPISATLKYDHCTVCNEDVEYLARKEKSTWNETAQAWTKQAPAAPAPRNPQAPAPAVRDEDDELNLDLDGDDERQANGRPPEITQQMRPTLDLGEGTHQLMLVSSDDIEANGVIQILVQVLAKNPVTAMFLVQNAHFQGRVAVKYGTEAELQALLQQVETAKTQIAASGYHFADTILNLQMVIEVRPNPNPAP